MKPDVTLQRLQLEARHKDRQAIMDQVFKTDIQAAPAASAPKAAKVAATPATISKPQAAQAPAPAFQPAASRASDNWAEAVQNALAHNQMQLLFQPIITLHGEPRYLYEAQLTLRTLGGQVVPPSEYLP